MAAAELQVVWERIDTMRGEHEALHRDVIALDAGVKALSTKVDDNRLVRDAQHAEILAAIKSLQEAESERSGMAKLGRGVATVIGAAAALAGLAFAFLGGHPK